MNFLMLNELCRELLDGDKANREKKLQLMKMEEEKKKREEEKRKRLEEGISFEEEVAIELNKM